MPNNDRTHGGLSIQYFKLYYIAIVIKTIWYYWLINITPWPVKSNWKPRCSLTYLQISAKKETKQNIHTGQNKAFSTNYALKTG